MIRDGKKRFDMAKKPKKASYLLYPIMVIASFFTLIWYRHKVKKINCKGLKAPYIVLATHSSMVDFNAAVKATFPNRVTWITSIEEFNRSEWLMRNIGCIAKRKFTKDPLVVKHCLRTIKNKGILIIYPEARFSFAGIPEHIDGALGKLVKTSKCPLIIMRNNGHYIQSPQFSKHPYRKIPLLSEFEQVVTREQVSTLTADEIQKIIEEKFYYDDYSYQKEHNYKVTCKKRMDNVHKVLYKCPHCNTEFEMFAKGTKIKCNHCNIEYELDEYGTLKCLNGETIFDSIPKWYLWEKEEVIKEVRSGKYYFEDQVKLEELFKPCVGFVPMGTVKFTHDLTGMKLEGKLDDGSDFSFFRPCLEQESCHVEFFFKNHKKEIGSAIDFATLDQTYFGWLVNQKEALTKIHLATEAIYNLALENKNK